MKVIFSAKPPQYASPFNYGWFFFILFLFWSGSCSQKKRDSYSNWGVYKADNESTSYSHLDQINKENVSKLALAWIFEPNDSITGDRPQNSESNPIIIDDVLYTTSARGRLFAVDAATGELKWSFDPFNGERGGGVKRGVTYWEDGSDQRILFTGGDKLFAIDASTGMPVPSFGNEGKVDLNEGMRGDPDKISVIPTSPGIIFEDLLILGTEVSELYGAEPGHVRAYNVRSGELVWTFHTIPMPGQVGHDSWPKDAWKYSGGANSWGGFSLDASRGMVFFATGSPAYDYYGANRKGKNLFGNSVVAVNARTGAYIWHFQTVHHDLWDYDLPAPPNLVTVEHEGKKMDAVAQTSKVGFLYVLNRETGKSLFPIEERPVPSSDIPGEETWPTQPFPTKPAPYTRQFLDEKDLANYSPSSRDSLVKLFRSLRYEGIFTPPSIQGTLQFPGSRGGSSWGGGAFDPSTGLFYVRSNDSPEIMRMKKVEPENAITNLSVYKQGESIYSTYCISCHGRDKNGDEQGNPSLVGLKGRISEEDVLAKIKQGGGKMPSFSSVITDKAKEEAILAFLFENESSGSPQEEQSLLEEINTNQGASTEIQNTDSLNRYLNLTAYGYFRDPEGRPGIKPPWGKLHAIDLNTGDFAWSVPLGNNRDLQTGSEETGERGSAGPMVTAGGLVFIAGTRDNQLRAFDKDTGEKRWEIKLPGFANANPSTYEVNGKQYIVLSVGGNSKNTAGSVMAFSLPD
ncbi:outer membrane protein assembly factor BamB family protein [Cyclobacterium marinum]|uniref:PQQ-dependent enzyme n=1 Tax=Cyclobacterium marinum (strain ATCC 25205 / DSM 745 / LMG 13164 / NCIMB 1802) TaxID=880070 RepID=G0IVC7_CYCMS|nr:PQQ-binding-like beta-propeller repeat protein [Cyclobacterium marinum]AEL27926.1 PQQ-dependent enzyme [Cyclobacterium marinum DSM 745]MBR9776797.1 PQQ-binding-like beta-propeller repeat protein [Cytophagales bacterium]